MGRESGHRTRTETGGRDLGCISVQKQDQKLVVGIWNAFRARGPKTFPGNRSVFLGTQYSGRCVTFHFRFFGVRKLGRFSVPEICRKTNIFPRSVFMILYFLAKIYVANNANRKMHYRWDPIKIERKTTIKI